MTQSITDKKRKIVKLGRKKELKKISEYYADISLAVKMDSKLSLEEILSKYSVENLKVQLVLKPHDSKIGSSAEVLEIWDIDWGEWEEF